MYTDNISQDVLPSRVSVFSSKIINPKSKILMSLNEKQIVFDTVEELGISCEKSSSVSILYTGKLWSFCLKGASAEAEQRSSISTRSDLRKHHVKKY